MQHKEPYDCLNCGDLTEVDGVPCQQCCDHDFDIDEGYTCLNCGEQGDYGDLIDAAEYTYGEDR